MRTDIKQAMHMDAAKSFSTAEANENERRWNEERFDQKNQDPTNHYDKTRQHLNFEIGPDGKIHPLGYQEKSLEVRLAERLELLGWHNFKEGSKNQPNMCAKFIFGGNHDRTLQMAFGDQAVCTDRGADNSHLHRCPEIERWAMDVYDWCVRRYGRENIIGFQVHLDETSPHIHALIVPVGNRKSGRECVMWSAKFGKNKYEYGHILKEMHTSLYEEVGSKYGLDRGDSIEGRQVQHLGKRDYIRKLNKDIQQSEKAIKGLKTMLANLQAQIEERQKQLEDLDGKLRSGKIHLQDYEDERKSLQRQIVDLHNKVYDKMAAIDRKESELAKLTKEVDAISSVIQPFRNHKIEFDPPRITEKPPLFGVDKWLDKQNDQIAKRFTSIVRKIESLYMQDAERQVKAAQKNVLADYRELNQLRGDYESLTDSSHQQDYAYRQLLDQLSVPSLRVQVLAIADALIGGRPIPSSGGGGGTTSDLRWDGRNPDEEEGAYRRRCLLQASKVVGRNGIKRKR